jgi:protein TonB
MIETNYILQTDLLDLLFEGRNKEYGAYQLRKQYSKRMLVAVSVMLISCLLLFLLFAFASGKKKSHAIITIGDPVIVKLNPDKKEAPPVLPPPKAIQPPIKTIRSTIPIITNDSIKPDEELHEVDELDNAKIGKINVDGEDSKDIIQPPLGEKNGVIVAPKKDEEDWEKTFIEVQIPSEYPGGIEAWRRFLGKNLRYPEQAVEKEIQGTVLVQFIVDKAGNVSDVEAISGPNELRDEAVRVIRKSGQWTPANQNGRLVKSYKRQPIVFQLQNE